MTKPRRSSDKEAPATPAKPTVPPRKTRSKLSRITFVMAVILLLGGIVYVRYQRESWPEIGRGEPLAPVTKTEEAAAAVGRTDPEVGEVMPSTIIKTEPENPAEQTEIEVLTPPAQTPAPQIVDVTEQVQATQEQPEQKDLAAAGLAQTTLKLAQTAQTQQVRLVALYAAYQTAAPEVPLLLAQTQATATPLQQQILTKLAIATQATGPVVLGEILRQLPSGKVATQAAPAEPKTMPNWWDRTVGHLVSVRQVAPAAQVPAGTSVAALVVALKYGDWQQVQALLETAPFNTADFAATRRLIEAYQAQRQALQQLLMEGLNG